MGEHNSKLVLAIDFDGTIASHDYPNIGQLFPHAKECINELYDSERYDIVIWSTRVDQDQIDMVNFLNDNGIKYHKINENIPGFTSKLQSLGLKTPRKIYYDILIDDRSLWGYSIDFETEWPMIKNLVELEYKAKFNNLKI